MVVPQVIQKLSTPNNLLELVISPRITQRHSRITTHDGGYAGGMLFTHNGKVHYNKL